MKRAIFSSFLNLKKSLFACSHFKIVSLTSDIGHNFFFLFNFYHLANLKGFVFVFVFFLVFPGPICVDLE